MIHWDWIATAALATPCVLVAFLFSVRIGEAIGDAYDTWHCRRAIERQKRDIRQRMYGTI